MNTNSSNSIIVCGHRGAPAHIAENTLASFVRASDDGATWIEFDVRPASDGTFVVHHDPDTADGTVIASAHPNDLSADIPTLGDVANQCMHLGLDIELKTDGTGKSAAQYAQLAAAEVTAIHPGIAPEVVVTSFDVNVLHLFKQHCPDVATGLLFHDRGMTWAVRTALDHGHEWVVPWHRLVSRTGVATAHDAGLRVSTWTVNKAHAIHRVTRAGVDMIIGDDPGFIMAELASSAG